MKNTSQTDRTRPGGSDLENLELDGLYEIVFSSFLSQGTTAHELIMDYLSHKYLPNIYMSSSVLSLRQNFSTSGTVPACTKMMSW